jgi:hypothetical protein
MPFRIPTLGRLATPCSTLLAAVALVGCEANLETGTPEATLDTAMRLVEEGRIDRLPSLIHLEARPVTFSDGVTEASAIEDVRGKLGDMLGQLARVSTKLKERYPADFEREGEVAQRLTQGGDFGARVSEAIMDPFAFLLEQRERLSAEDLGDGTAALSLDDEPAAGGLVSMVETDEGWRFTVPIELARASEFWPESRHEWAVIASMMLAIENSLDEFEQEIDAGNFRDLDHAGERVGRLLGESVVVQSVIYATMKRSGKGADLGSGT